jgi:hypothetical protein
MEIFGVPIRPAGQPVAGRADQWLVLRHPQPRAGDHLRPAQHHQFRPRRPVHDGCLHRLARLTKFNVNYWVALIAAPLLVGLFGVILERTMLRKLYKLDHLYGLLLTFGLA